MSGVELALMIPLSGIGTGALAIYLHHVRKLAEIKARTLVVQQEQAVTRESNASGDIRTELAELREEVRRLRDTSTKFDMSFDAGLTRLEERVERVETNRYAPPEYATNREKEVVTLSGR